MGYRIAVVGATGSVGREMLQILAERQFPVEEVAALASARSQGDVVDFGDSGRELKVNNLENFDFSGFDFALFAAGSAVSKAHAPRAAQAGCVVIDNSSFYRMDPDVPLIVPEVNPEAIAGYRAKNIVANPNCSTAQMVVALKPLHDAAGIKRVVVSTYQSVSGAGKQGMDELFQQSRNIFVGDSADAAYFTKQIAFNVIPHIDDFLDDGSTKEEGKMVVETKKILHTPDIEIAATCVRVPVLRCHSESLNVEFSTPVSVESARAALAAAPGITILDDPAGQTYPMPAFLEGTDDTFVGRLRVDPTVENGLAMWVVADQLRKGAALNAVQIAEELLR